MRLLKFTPDSLLVDSISDRGLSISSYVTNPQLNDLYRSSETPLHQNITATNIFKMIMNMLVPTLHWTCVYGE